MTVREHVLDVLNNIVDPCSVASGAPLGLVDMGVVTAVEIDENSDEPAVRVTLALTSPGCLMGGPFVQSATSELQSALGFDAVHVELTYAADWSVASMSSEGRRKWDAALVEAEAMPGRQPRPRKADAARHHNRGLPGREERIS